MAARHQRHPQSLEKLWAPWRDPFITQQTKPTSCIFCDAKRARNSRIRYVLLKSRHTFALLNLYPYNNGHVMIAPTRHVGDLAVLRPEEWVEMLRVTQRLIKVLRHRLRAQGFNVGMNVGRVAGAGIPGHLHLHLVPRWDGDTNFMPILAQTKVISQSLDALHDTLTRALRPR